MRKKKIVITGIGIVSSIGIGKGEFWDNLFKGKSGLKPITLFDTSELNVNIAGEVADFYPKQILNEERLMDLDRATLLLMCAVKLCLDDAPMQVNDANTYQTGIVAGTTFGSLNSISRFNQESFAEGPRYVNPSIFPSTVGNSPASRVSIRFKIKGFSSTISTGMCAALDALDYARDFIQLEKTQNILVGSVEDLSIQTFLGFYKLKYLSGTKDNSREPVSCPFDKRRNGIVFGEGATSLLLQDEDRVKKQNVNIYGEILGVGSSFDTDKFYRYNPKGTGMKQAMEAALEDADLEAQDIDCIFANANSTKDADFIETKAIKEVFKEKVRDIPVTAIKSLLGETVSNSGGAATVAALGALDKNMIPATINYKQKDSDCDLDYVVNKPRSKKISKVMINCFGPNGANTSIIVGKYRR